nr:hypothetical protein Cry52Nrm1_p165 [Cryptomonas curvata]
MFPKVLNYNKLCYFLNQKFWFQFNILNQKFVILSKKVSIVAIRDFVGNFLNIYSKTLIKYYNIFNKLLYSTIPHKTLSVILIGICRFDLIYIEDKIAFLENHIRIYWHNNFFKFSILPTILVELINYKIWLGDLDCTNNFFHQLQHILASFRIFNLKNFYHFGNKQTTLSLKRIIVNFEKDIDLELLSSTKSAFKLHHYIQQLLEKAYKYPSRGIVAVKFSKYFDFSNNFLCFFFNTKNDEKENWFQINSILRLNNYQNISRSFFENFQLYNYIFYTYFSYSKKQEYLKHLSCLLSEKFKKNSLRLSSIGRSKNLTPSEIGLVLIHILLRFNYQNSLDAPRQILKNKKTKNNCLRYFCIDAIDKKLNFILLYTNCLSLVNAIKKK